MVTERLCTREVVVIRRDELVKEAARLMRQYQVGDVVVVEGEEGRRRPIGIVTDRDIVLRVLAEGRDATQTKVNDIMSADLLTVGVHQDIYETLESMRAKGVRRVPVVDAEGLLVGILSVDDVIDVMSVEMRDLATLIQREHSREARQLKVEQSPSP